MRVYTHKTRFPYTAKKRATSCTKTKTNKERKTPDPAEVIRRAAGSVSEQRKSYLSSFFSIFMLQVRGNSSTIS